VSSFEKVNHIGTRSFSEGDRAGADCSEGNTVIAMSWRVTLTTTSECHVWCTTRFFHIILCVSCVYVCVVVVS
jgi:hypothetical protein